MSEILKPSEPQLPDDSLASYAVVQLDRFLETPEEAVLREDQVNVFQSIRDSLAAGKTSGYLELPTGYGKSVIIAKLTEALNLRTLVLSPTQQILEQNERVVNDIAPEVDITNYYTEEKDAEGYVVNTTYQSAYNLVNKGTIDPQDFELMLLDEAHLSLGEQRHKILKQFPHALKIGLTATPSFDQLEGYERRGIIDKDEEWVELFRNKIHKMDLEEAIERDILTDVDVTLIGTSIPINSVRVRASGEYDPNDLEKFINTTQRNFLTLAMVAGEDVLPDNITIDESELKMIQKINGEITGKQTAIFGLTIDHVETLNELFQKAGLASDTFHSKKTPEQRREIMRKYKSGELQYVLGVNMLGLGWDSPETEVGIFLAPSRSGIKVKQEFGRILRPNTATGKSRAIAIQVYDHFAEQDKQPVLIPDLFNKEYVVKGWATGSEPGVSDKTEKPKVRFDSVDFDVDLFFRKLKTEDLRQKVIKEGALDDVNELLDIQMQTIFEENPDIRPLEFYRKLANLLPERFSRDIQRKTRELAKSEDPEEAHKAQRALSCYALRSILSGIEQYLSDNADENDDLVQSAVLRVFEKLQTDIDMELSELSYLEAERAAVQVVAEREGVPATWVVDGRYKTWPEQIRKYVATHRIDLSSKESSEAICNQIHKELGIGPKIARRLLDSILPGIEQTEEEKVIENVRKANLSLDIEQRLNNLSESAREVLELRFGLQGYDEHTLDQTARLKGVTPARIRQIEAKGLRNLRHPRNSRWLRGYLSDNYDLEYFMDKRSIPVSEREIYEKVKNVPVDTLNLTDEEVSLAEKMEIRTIGDLWRANIFALRAANDIDLDFTHELQRRFRIYKSLLEQGELYRYDSLFPQPDKPEDV